MKGNAYTACDSTGRLMEQSGNGLASRMPGMGRLATGRSYGSALITQAEWQACNAARSYGRQIAKL